MRQDRHLLSAACATAMMAAVLTWSATALSSDPITATNTMPAPETAPAGPVTLRAILSRTTCSGDGRACSLLKVDYAAIDRGRNDRPTLNIALVLDSSGSMAEARKLPYTLEAARWVVDNLTDRDSLALVTFDDQANVLSGAGRVVNKPFLLHRLDEIVPEHFTNLSAGLLEGIAQVSGQLTATGVNQVLLLTDGQANRGNTDIATLRKIAERARARGIGVSTFGVGTEFNETLLAAIADAAAGRYVYIAKPEEIPDAFKGELHGLLQAVAQNVALEVSLTGGTISRIFGQLQEQPLSSYRVALGDLRAAEQGYLLMQLSAASGEDRPLEVDVRLVFDEVEAGERVSRTAQLHSSTALAEDPASSLLASVLDAVEQADTAAQGFDIERYRWAQVSFDKLYARAREFAMRNREQDLLNETFVLKHFMQELAVAQQAGLLHGHREAREKLRKESHYLRYLLTHHRPPS